MKDKLYSIIGEVSSNGKFHCDGHYPMIYPGMTIEGIGEISFPLTPEQAQKIVSVAHQAPFGKGEKTVVDTSVRKVWEINPEHVYFQNPDWVKAVEKITNTVKDSLGLQDSKVTASLYKLLIYEEGGFFLPHKDSEKEKGMFGTLVIGLPSQHQGGELQVRFGREECTTDFSKAQMFEFPFVAFYADCEHEIKPIISGFRICLTYNLVLNESQNIPSASIMSLQTEKLTDFFSKELPKSKIEWPLAILLDHQYTPSNFSLNSLKLHDKPRAVAILEAAEKSGFYAKLGLLTRYLMGELEYESYPSRRKKGRYYDDYEDEFQGEGASMGEIYEDSTHVENWAKEGECPNLGSLDMEKSGTIWASYELGEGNPEEQEEEGFTGNAGMTLQYWYHYGAIILWPKGKTMALVKGLSIMSQIEWLSHFVSECDLNDKKSVEQLRDFTLSILEKVPELRWRAPNLDALPNAIMTLDTPSIFAKMPESWEFAFPHISPEVWSEVFQKYPLEFIERLVRSIGTKSGSVLVLLKTIEILAESNDENAQYFVSYHLEDIGYHISPMGWEGVQVGRDIVALLLRLGQKCDKIDGSTIEILENLQRSSSRHHVNDILAETLLKTEYPKSGVSDGLMAFCISELELRIDNKPMPPEDFVRTAPEKVNLKDEYWSVLIPFLRSPTQEICDYAALQAKRNTMESLIRSYNLDISMQTIRKGSPHTLRLTKNTASYQKLLTEWVQDVRLRERLAERS